jgi:hypothetical protein
MSDRCKPHIGHFDRNTIAVVSDHHELMTPKQARTLGHELIEAADLADALNPVQVIAAYEAEQARLREEFPEQFADEADIAADTEPCTCPMSVREKMPEEIVNQPFREVAGDNFAAEPGPHHSRGCPLWKPLTEVH